jgi:calcineurin-like phosphoesterase family protein
MGTVITQAWLEAVPHDADVFFLGDVAMKMNPNRLNGVLHSLPGKKYLIVGNHDKLILKRDILRSCFEVVCDIGEVVIDGKQVVMCHYPLESWPGRYRSVLHLHGHSHGKSRMVNNRVDVGVDATGDLWRPITWAEVLNIRDRITDTLMDAMTDGPQPPVASESMEDSDL